MCNQFKSVLIGSASYCAPWWCYMALCSYLHYGCPLSRCHSFPSLLLLAGLWILAAATRASLCPRGRASTVSYKPGGCHPLFTGWLGKGASERDAENWGPAEGTQGGSCFHRMYNCVWESCETSVAQLEHTGHPSSERTVNDAVAEAIEGSHLSVVKKGGGNSLQVRWRRSEGRRRAGVEGVVCSS